MARRADSRSRQLPPLGRSVTKSEPALPPANPHPLPPRITTLVARARELDGQGDEDNDPPSRCAATRRHSVIAVSARVRRFQPAAGVATVNTVSNLLPCADPAQHTVGTRAVVRALVLPARAPPPLARGRFSTGAHSRFQVPLRGGWALVGSPRRQAWRAGRLSTRLYTARFRSTRSCCWLVSTKVCSAARCLRTLRGARK
jgi:hypothetical protein